MTTCPAPAGFFLARFKPVSARWPFGGSPPSGFRPDSRQAPSPPSVYFGVRPCFRFPGLRAWRPWKKTFHFAAINVFLPQRTRKNFPVGFAPMHHLFTEVRYRWLRAPATNSLPSKINTLARCEAGFFLPKRVANCCHRKPWISGHFQTLPKIPCNTGATRVNSMFTSCAPSEMTTNCTRSGNSMHRGREPTIQLFSITKRNTPASSPDSRSGFPVTLQKDSKSRTDPGSVDSTSSVSPA